MDLTSFVRKIREYETKCPSINLNNGHKSFLYICLWNCIAWTVVLKCFRVICTAFNILCFNLRTISHLNDHIRNWFDLPTHILLGNSIIHNIILYITERYILAITSAKIEKQCCLMHLKVLQNNIIMWFVDKYMFPN